MKSILDSFKNIVAKIANKLMFWKKAEEGQAKKINMGLVWLIVGIALAVLVGWYAVAKLMPKPIAKDGVATTAEAKITIVTSRACGSKCWDAQLFIDALTQQGIKVADKETVYVGGWWPFGKGKDIAKTYQITKVPTVIVEFTGKNKPDINKFFSPTLGSVINEKFVLTKILAPYINLAENKLKGLIKVTYLVDGSCKECYDIKKHETALKNLGAYTDNNETIDISSDAGKELINRYVITKAPTLLISGEVSEYSVLTQAWQGVGAVAPDGTYVFMNQDLMGDYYRDLITGKIVKAKEIPATPAETAPAVKN